MKTFLLFIIFLLLSVNHLFSDVIEVPSQYATIQHAIDSCNSGDTILVAPGEYRESLVMRRKNLVFASHFIVQSDTNKIDSTILKSSNGSIFTADSYVDSIIIIGFKIEGNDGDRGGAVYVYSTKAILKNNYFYFSSAGGWRTGYGGAIYALEAEVMLHNNRFENCKADYGGAVYASNGELVVKNNIFRYNRALDDGGALRIAGAIVEIDNNAFTQNWAFSNGGAVYCWNSSGIIKNNLISENVYVDLDSSGSNYGGGIYCSGPISGSSMLKVLNNVIEKNIAYSGSGLASGNNVLVQNNLIIGNKDGLGSAIYVTGDTRIVNNTIYGNNGYSTIYIQSGWPEITNNIIWNNKLSNEWKTIYNEAPPGETVVTYNDIQDGYEGTGNFSSDPLFRDVALGDYHLKSTSCGDNADSPCIDSGSPVYTDSLLHCDAGLGTVASDVGAYGGGIGQPTSIDNKLINNPSDFFIIRVIPNPFNAQTRMVFSVDQPQHISVKIYNSTAEIIRTVHDGPVSAGIKSFVWDGKNDNGAAVASNLYFVKVSSGSGNYFKKIVLIK